METDKNKKIMKFALGICLALAVCGAGNLCKTAIYAEEESEDRKTAVRTAAEGESLPESYTENEITYELTEMTKVQQKETGRTASAKAELTRNAVLEGEHLEKMPVYTYIDPWDGEKKKFDNPQYAAYVSSEYVSSVWIEGIFQGQMTVTGYEYKTYVYQGVELPVDEERPIAPEYYRLILQEQGLSEDEARITDVSWSGESYTDGVTWYRDAVITGDLLCPVYTDYFEGTVDIPDRIYYTEQGYYTETEESFLRRMGTKAVSESETEEEPAKEQEPLSEQEASPFIKFLKWIGSVFRQAPVPVSIGILVLAGALTAILMTLKKRRKES